MNENITAFSIAGTTVDDLHKLMVAYETHGFLGQATLVNVRRTRRYIEEMTMDTSIKRFLQTTNKAVKLERVRYFKTFADVFTKHVLKQRKYAHNKIALYLNSIINAMYWANNIYGCSFIIVEPKSVTPKVKMEPPVKVIPLEEVDKILKPSPEATLEIANNPFLQDSLFLAQTILLTALRPSDAGNLRRENLEVRGGQWLVHSVNRKTGKDSFAIVPEWWAHAFQDRCEQSNHNRPMTANVEEAEIKDPRKTVGGKYIEQKAAKIFKYNQIEKIEDDDYYVRNYIRTLYTQIKLKDIPYKTYLREVVRLCGLNFKTVLYRRVGNKHVREAFTHEDVTSYTLRRTAITRLLSAGLDAEVVKTSSGHSATSTSFNRYLDKREVLFGGETIEKINKLNNKR